MPPLANEHAEMQALREGPGAVLPADGRRPGCSVRAVAHDYEPGGGVLRMNLDAVIVEPQYRLCHSRIVGAPSSIV
jgi:hypothetical protein